MQMLNRARAVIRKYGTNDPESILELLKVKLFFLPTSGIRGIYKRIEGHTIVFVDSNLDERTRTFVLAHELGHHLLHKGTNRIFLDRCTLLKTSRYEDEADLFATCLLAPWPDDVLFEGETMDDLATRIGVRREVAEMYLNEVRWR